MHRHNCTSIYIIFLHTCTHSWTHTGGTEESAVPVCCPLVPSQETRAEASSRAKTGTHPINTHLRHRGCRQWTVRLVCVCTELCESQETNAEELGAWETVNMCMNNMEHSLHQLLLIYCSTFLPWPWWYTHIVFPSAAAVKALLLKLERGSLIIYLSSLLTQISSDRSGFNYCLCVCSCPI